MAITSSNVITKNPAQGQFVSGIMPNNSNRPAKPTKINSFDNPLQNGKVKRTNNGQNSTSKTK